MAGLIVAMVVVIGGVFHAGHKEKVFKNDTTVQDTIAFERNASETAIRHVQAIEQKNLNSMRREEERVTSNK